MLMLTVKQPVLVSRTIAVSVATALCNLTVKPKTYLKLEGAAENAAPGLQTRKT